MRNFTAFKDFLKNNYPTEHPTNFFLSLLDPKKYGKNIEYSTFVL